MRREPRVTRRADNAGEMCTGIIFPSKCGVIEKKNENLRRDEGEREGGGKRRGGNSTLPKLSGLYFAGRGASGGWRERGTRQAIQLDAVGWTGASVQ